MAVKTMEIHLDDIDGTEDAETRFFYGPNGVQYQIDLSGENLEELDILLDQINNKFLPSATKVPVARSPRRGRRSGGTARRSSADTTKIREWAKENGVEVSERGRIPASVVEQYQAAQKGQAEA